MFGFRKKLDIPDHSIAAPVSGQFVPLENVVDPVFAQKMMGDGFAIIPDSDYIVAPCSGKITMLYPTMHAFGITNKDGIEVLVHIGINTVELKGKGFTKYVTEGDTVEVGDKIIRMNSYEMKNSGYDLSTMVLFPNIKSKLSVKKEGSAVRGKTIAARYE